MKEREIEREEREQVEGEREERKWRGKESYCKIERVCGERDRGKKRRDKLNEWVSEWVSEFISEQVSELVRECVSKPVNEWVSKWVNEWVNVRGGGREDKERGRRREAATSSLLSRKSRCSRAYGSGSQCRPNWMHIGSGETLEGSGFWPGGYVGRVKNRRS